MEFVDLDVAVPPVEMRLHTFFDVAVELGVLLDEMNGVHFLLDQLSLYFQVLGVWIPTINIDCVKINFAIMNSTLLVGEL